MLMCPVNSNNGIVDGDTKTSLDATMPRSRDRVCRAPRRQRNDHQHRPYDTHEGDEEKPWRRGYQTPSWRDHRGVPTDGSLQYQMPWQPVDYPQWQPSPWQLPGNWYSNGGGQQNFVNRPGGAGNEQTDYGAPYYGHPTYYGAGYPSQ